MRLLRSHQPHRSLIHNWPHFANFSSELLVLGLVLSVAGFNLFGLSLGSFAAANRDHSLAEELLGNHYALNQKLYNETHVINTAVAGTRLVAEAYADTASGDISGDVSEAINDDNYTDEGALTNENLSNVTDLLKLNVHVSQPGETLGAIARDCGLTVEDLKTANRLTSDTIKPGWNIVCFKGVAYTATANDTFLDIVKYFSGDAERTIAYNALDGPNVEVGQLIFIPDGHYPAPKPSPTAAPKPRSPYSVPTGSLYKGGHSFPKSQCTYLASQLFGGVPWGGNAGRWDDNAKAFGYPVDKRPCVGCIIVTNESRYGHVGYVTAVNGDTVTIRERNYVGPYIDSTRTISRNSSVIQAYIHHK